MQLAEDTATGERVAIKFIPRLGLDELTVARELLNQRACALHPNIIQLQVASEMARLHCRQYSQDASTSTHSRCRQPPGIHACSALPVDQLDQQDPPVHACTT